MRHVLVIDKNKKPGNPCHPGKARSLLKEGRAAVFRQYPFTIILKEESHENVQPLRLKIDPGSKKTGIALVDDTTGKVPFMIELEHRSLSISTSMTIRRNIRSSRRSRKTRYRKPRFNNRTSKQLPPSIESRIAHILTWVSRLRQYSPIGALSIEVAKFDTQKMERPEISGVEYQQGELLGFEVREYLLEKYNRTCVYCKAKNIPVEIDHIVPKSKGGSNRVSNLTLACRSCNQRKGNQTAEEFGHPEVHKTAKKPLRDAAAMNITRPILVRHLQALGLPLEIGTGAQTKYNRAKRGLEKTHWHDAACVGSSTPTKLIILGTPLLVKATGHGSRQMCRVDRYGFPRTGPKKAKKQFGYQTGDMVKAYVPSGKKQGTYRGKVAVRSNGYFNITTPSSIVQGIKHSHCKIIHKSDGYTYSSV